ncbi:dynein light chain Tctex-type 1 [Paragonimus westermani]|uniref:Dynein light chain Tctex-type 1 n=1 Tax=Paragonimus westermani TaxID=34504 RepID=A0A5J4NPT9_9TREM|nr:dynein light chain Tctex-type 1 [Paragonimus westermani]
MSTVAPKDLLTATPAALKFNAEEVESIIKKNLQNVIGQSAYAHEKTPQWARGIIEGCLDRLVKLSKPFKYIVNCTIAQKNGGGLYNASSCYWDNTKDDTCTVNWENKTMHVIVTVFAAGI